jgi:hypothetical protein
MKLFKISFLAGIAAMLVMGLTGSAFAFHDGGVARCEGCHTMHNSLQGNAMHTYKSGGKAPAGGAELVGNQYLLQASDASSTCLGCHGVNTDTLPVAGKDNGYHIATNIAGFDGTSLPVEMTPGGDFSWLLVAFSNASTSAGKFHGSYAGTTDETKNRHGHHIVAADYGLLASTDYASISNQAPGGTYPVGSLGCNSCHNPHSNLVRSDFTPGLPISGSGSYGGTADAGTALGVYRFLGGNGYSIPGTGVPSFTADPPTAVAPSSYNHPESAGINRVAYGSGMSEWCANCHGGILNNAANADPSTTGATLTHKHIAGASAKLSGAAPLSEVPATIYQNYLNSGNTNAGGGTYWTLVPYEMGTTNITDLTTASGSNTECATAATGNVMCLSCHRAHASGFSSMARFDIDNTFVTDPTAQYAFNGKDYEAHPDQSGYYERAYYETPVSTFGPSQRSLCNKCHARD